MRLDGSILQGHDLISFCDMRTKSYVKAQPRSVTPPPDKIFPLSSNIDAIPSSSNDSSHWTAAPKDIDIALNQSTTTNPSSSTSDPWTVNEDDVQDSIGALAQKPQDNGESSNKGVTPFILLYSDRSSALVDEGVLFGVTHPSRVIKSLAEL
jgi:hypothetical protein